ncbi:MAG: ribonuclease P protein component [Parcubacteria group bacterium]|nr:ribonuclease P protein component [Parcubacteria group bacterium]
MLPKANRLQKDDDFARVHRHGRFFKCQFVAIKSLSNRRPESRFGFLVGIKVSKKAIVRNKVKRRLREVVRLALPDIKPGFDVVIMVRPEAADKTYQEIETALRSAFQQARLLTS